MRVMGGESLVEFVRKLVEPAPARQATRRDLDPTPFGPALRLWHTARVVIVRTVTTGSAAGDLVMAAPAANDAVIEPARQAGVEPARSPCHMRFGPEGAFGRRGPLLALASLGFG